MNNKKPSIFDLADWFLAKSSMTPKKLQKISYYGVAWGYALLDERIVSDSRFEAWIHGPVSPLLYKKYEQFGWKEIPKINNYNNVFNSKETELLESVWYTYGGKSANELEMLTHQDLPWQNARKGYAFDEPCNNLIKVNDMKKYYRELYAEAQGE